MNCADDEWGCLPSSISESGRELSHEEDSLSPSLSLPSPSSSPQLVAVLTVVAVAVRLALGSKFELGLPFPGDRARPTGVERLDLLPRSPESRS
ncbi:hypothetical protein NL676_007621 [Syzygium grande]|nr:hypothetical protein NL676_007621 [Syzygium grande]